MVSTPVVQEAILDAFEGLLVDVGERAATLDAVAKRAGISKGGLLHHFPNKEALVTATLKRLDRLAVEDLNLMAMAPEGAAAYFIKASLWSDTPLDRCFVATTRLAEVTHHEARRHFASIQQRWWELIAKDVGECVATAVLYMGNGLYFNAMWESGASLNVERRQADVKKLLIVISGLSGR